MMCKASRIQWSIFVLCGVVWGAGCAKNESGASETDANQVKQEISEAVNTTGDYLSQQGKTMLESVQQTYSELDKAAQPLIASLKASGRESWETLATELKRKVEDAGVRLSDIEEASQDDLQDAKDAFEVAIAELREAYEKAKAEYDKGRGQE